MTAAISLNGYGASEIFLAGSGANTGTTLAGSLGTVAAGLAAYLLNAGQDAAADNANQTVFWYITGLTPGVTTLTVMGNLGDATSGQGGASMLVEAY